MSFDHKGVFSFTPVPGSDVTVVLLPGLFAADWIWEKAKHCLQAEGYSTLTLNCAFAEIPAKAKSIDSLRFLVDEAVKSSMPNTSRLVICGNSLGGLVAIDYAVHYPERVLGLVISGTPGMGTAPTLGIDPRDISLKMAKSVAGQIFYDPSAVTEEMIGKCYGYFLDRKNLINIARYLLATKGYDVEGALARLHAMLLMVWGENDGITPYAPWERVVSLVPRARLVTIPRCGHSPMLEQAEGFNKIMMDSLDAWRAQVGLVPN